MGEQKTLEEYKQQALNKMQAELGEHHEELKDFTPQCHHLRWLTDHLSGWQFGEQGLLYAILQALNITDGYCVEYGAGDGETLPLTIDPLYKNESFVFALVEIERHRRDKLSIRYPNAIVKRVANWFTFKDQFTAVVVIDIDGSDSVVMRQMFAAGVRPAVLVVEHFDNHYPIATTKACMMPEWMLGLRLESGHIIQDTAETLHAIAIQNGYERIGWNRCNSFFVVRERYTDLFR